MYGLAHWFGIMIGVILRMYDDMIEGGRDGIADSRDWGENAGVIRDELNFVKPLIDFAAVERVLKEGRKHQYGSENHGDESNPAPGTETLDSSR